MSVTVTIHSGELKQIKRLIESETRKNPANGQLYGLWTHSNQPVIQYIIGDPKGSEDVTEFLWENHGLRHVGNWSTEELKNDGATNGTPAPSFVNMTVGLQLLEGRKTLNVKLGVVENQSKSTVNGALETLEGESAFRLKSPFWGDQKLQKRYHASPESGKLDVNDVSPKQSHEAKTNKAQWYSTEEGLQLFGKIHGALQKHFEVRPSRDTTTHDICLSLKSKGIEFAVDFPHSFPHESAILIKAGNPKEAIVLTKASSEGGNTEGSKEEKAPKSAKDEANAQDTDAEGNLDPPPTSAQDEKIDKGAEENGGPGSEEIPQLLVQEIHRLVFGTSV